MEQREEYEPFILDLQKSQAIRQSKHYVPLFVLSAAIFGIFILFAALYFKQPTAPPAKPSIPPPAPQVMSESTAPAVKSTPTVTPTVTPIPMGRLTLYSIPDNAEVMINGKVLGRTPLSDYELTPGTYTVKFSHKGQMSQQKLLITAGETAEFTHRFEGFGSLNIDTTSSGSDITINGKPAGKSPLLVEGLAAGTYTIGISKIGYATTEKTVTLKQGEHLELFITIKRLSSVRPAPSEAPSTSPGRPLHPSERLQ